MTGHPEAVRRIPRVVTASARGVLAVADRLDDTALPIAGRMLAGAAAWARHGCEALLGRAGEVAGRLHLDVLTDVLMPGAGRRPAAVGEETAAQAGEAAARADERPIPDPAVFTARYGAGVTVVRRGMRILVLGAAGTIAMTMVAGLLRGPGGGRFSAQVGDPRVGAQVQFEDGFPSSARVRLAELAHAPEQPDIDAVVSFPGYRTPEQTVELLADLPVVEVFFRVPPDGGTLSARVAEDRVSDGGVSDGATVPASAAGSLAAIRAAFEQATQDAADRIHPAADHGARERAVDEVAALRDFCACVYGAVVRAPARRLVLLAGTGTVRLVDVATPDVLGPPSVVTPLLPEQP